ncbi:MAG: hypothetical protein CL398_03425 [Acidiferrobacteraceae bacterium]|nr:hypothetical protein [Acidiferrobacteraceae bacterium]|tara:strand:- start:1401 stop:1835 length:435 start_codon:yes stop_codon:yes gene_type:complete
MSNIIRRNNNFSNFFAPTFGGGGLDRFFDDLFATSGGLSRVATDVRVKDQEHDWQIAIPAPGLTKKDFKISVKETSARPVLSVSFDGTSFDHSFVQSFHRSWTLPAGVTTDSIAAQFRNGVLTVTVQKPDPKAEEAGEVTITVK